MTSAHIIEGAHDDRPLQSNIDRNLKIVLVSEKIAYTLDKTPPKEAHVNATPDELEKLETWSYHNLQARCYMLASMANELQRRFEELVNAKDIHIHLQELYGVQTRSVRHATIKELMTAHIILLSLSSSFDNFVVNFNMNKLEAILEELVDMLANYEATIKKEKSIFLMGSSSRSKKGPKKKGKKRFAPMKKIKPNKPRPT
ncbi:hypothetical protein ZIOFF_055480 [Zingiber officinale]|uniref:Uncharacterized protein n=1 Tax=Zingiber officinale TaxID=94328 RepID=A0A8J5FBZ1_ZINOF|nr:hypothetical protein ZIOFF_055480 [Zingiber officinale]